MATHITWLDWLSTRGEAREKKKDGCLFVGPAEDIPCQLKEQLNIVEDKGKYCIIEDV